MAKNYWQRITGKSLSLWGSIASILGLGLGIILFFLPQSGKTDSNTTHGNQSPIIGGAGRDVNINYGEPIDKQREKMVVNLRRILESECQRNRKKIDYMFKDAEQRYMIHMGKFNAYALPKFSNTVKQQFQSSSILMQTDDPDVLSVVEAVGQIDYEDTFERRHRDGSIYDNSVRDYILNLHNVCDWVSVDLGHRAYFEK